MLDDSRPKRETERMHRENITVMNKEEKSDERPPQSEAKAANFSASAKFSDLLMKFYETSFRPSSINISKTSHTITDIRQVLIEGHPDIHFSLPKYQDFLAIALEYQPSHHLSSTY